VMQSAEERLCSDATALSACECQSFLDNVIAGPGRFDSDKNFS
jgi:hypothetical protein